MKLSKVTAPAMALLLILTACNTAPADTSQNPESSNDGAASAQVVEIRLDDSEIIVDGKPAESNVTHAVYVGNDIVYYEAGKDFTYGEGSDKDAHSAKDAAEHAVIHITQPGTYSISGSLPKGQIAIDLGDGAEEDPEAVVTLILNGVDITCEVAPAIIFYNVYECGIKDADTASETVDTSSAGANVIIADGTTNTVNGSYVARIYNPDSVELNEGGTEVLDAKKLHKYDAAFYSKMSMNVSGGPENNGTLIINAENEGLDSELHLTINGGIIHINSGNDGINTNEDGISVTTINGGDLHIQVTGETGEGDGIDSNGWLVINGGSVAAQACSFSGDAGIDSDMGIHINGGKVIATGHMLDRIEDGGQNYAVFTFAEQQSGGNSVSLKCADGDSILETTPENDYSILIYSSPELVEGTYTLWSDDIQLAGQRGSMMGGPGMPGMPGMMPDGGTPPELPEGMMPGGVLPPEPPEGMAPPEGGTPFGGPTPPAGLERPDGENPGGRPNGQWSPGNRGDNAPLELTTEFQIANGGNMFQSISPAN